MIKQRWLWIAALAASSLSHGPVRARTGTSILLEEMDADEDGVVTTLEFEQHAMARWAERDLNRDGKVTRDEVASTDPGNGFHEGERAHLPGDTDHDGAVSEAEAVVEARRLATQLDTDQDGTLGEDELDAGRHVRVQSGGDPPVALSGRTAAGRSVRLARLGRPYLSS
jgi:hypothetical protein